MSELKSPEELTESGQKVTDSTIAVMSFDREYETDGRTVVESNTDEPLPGTEGGYVTAVRSAQLAGVSHVLVCDRENVDRVWVSALQSEAYTPVEKYKNDKIPNKSYVHIRYDRRS